MKALYTDNTYKLSKLNLEYELLKIEDWNNDLKSLFLICDKHYDVKSIIDKGVIITLFESNYSDFEILDFNKEIISSRLDYFYNISNKIVAINSLESKYLASKEDSDESLDIHSNNINIENINTFKGIYIQGVLIKKGNIRFLPIFEVILYIFKAKFKGKLSIKKRDNEIYLLSFDDGEIVNIESFKEDDNFQFFLKKYGYISKINKDIYFLSVEKQLDIFINNNNIFKHEKSIIYKDYISFLFRNIISLESGDFEIIEESLNDKLRVFSDYLGFLYNFINYLKTKETSFENFIITEEFFDKIDDKNLSDEILNFLFEIKNGKNKVDLFNIFSKYEKEYIERALLFFMIIGIITNDNNDNYIRISSQNVSENISKRILIWLDKIKKENYFTLLGIDINDNEDFLEEKFRNLFSQFSNYLSSNDIRTKYKNDLEDIIFELEVAYNVLKDKNLKEKYYNGMLK